MNREPDGLSKRVALVTGAGAGIGKATAAELARRGASVALHYRRSREGAEQLAGSLPRAAAFGADLTRGEEVRRLVREVEERLGPIDILVNNAGDLVERRPLLEMSEEVWRAVLDVNLTTAFLCSQAVARAMVDRRRGVIVNLSSLAAHNGGGPGAFAYATAKGGILSLTRALAKELAPAGIRVNCVAPGLIDHTDFHGRFTPRESFEAVARGIPLGRAGEPEDVAQVIAFLCGDESAFLTGETIEINGGAWMR